MTEPATTPEDLEPVQVQETDEVPAEAPEETAEHGEMGPE